MNFKKTAAVILAAMALMTAGLTACGDSSSSSGGSSKSDASESTKAASAVADELKGGVTFKDSLNELDKALYEKFYGITEDMFTDGKIYIGSGGATAEEIACFDAKDSESAAKIKEACEARVDSQKKAFEDYHPEELTKLGDPVIVTKGNSVYMCISDDNAAAKEIIG